MEASQARTAATRPPRLLIVLPYDMTARNWLATPVASELARTGADLHFVTRDAVDAAAVSALGSNASWHPLCRPSRQFAGVRRSVADARWVAGFWLHLMLVFRHGSIQNFKGFTDRLKQSRTLRQRALKEGLPFRRWLGFPAPRSKIIYDSLQRFYWSGFFRHRFAEAALDEIRPNAIVLGHCQNHFVAPYVMAAHSRGVPVLGVNGSWDQPTTKGPVVRGLSRMLVESRHAITELQQFHGLDPAIMSVVGWPQFDPYGSTQHSIGQEDAPRHLILVGAYSDRLGRHEPEMCRSLVDALRRGAFGTDAVLHIRCHPLETKESVERRFGALHAPPRVIVSRPNLADLDTLRDLIRQSACVISSAGTINLDAVALDTPSIAVAFEDDSEPFYDRPSRRFAMEHIAAVTQNGGIRLVRNQAELEDAIAAYIHNPRLDADKRADLRRDHLDPLDGRSSQRLAKSLIDAVEHHIRERALP